MSEQQFAFAVAELTRLSYECETCKTLLVFDVTTNPQFGYPRVCPTCHKDNEQFTLVLGYYLRFFEEAAKLKTLQLRTKPLVISE